MAVTPATIPLVKLQPAETSWGFERYPRSADRLAENPSMRNGITGSFACQAEKVSIGHYFAILGIFFLDEGGIVI